MAKKKKSNNLVRNLLIIVGVLVVGAIFARSMGWLGKEKLPEVYTAKVSKTTITEKVGASGKIQPEIEVKISPEVSGEIVDVLVKEGDSVTQGQLLLRIRPDILRDVVQSSQATFNSVRSNLAQVQAQLLQQKAQMERNKIEYERSKQLYEQKVVSQTDFLTAKTNYEVSQQQVAAAEKTIEAAGYNVQSSQANLNQQMNNLSRTEIYAPTNGTISKLSVEKGEKVVGTAQMAGTEMLRLANLNNMEVEVDVNENDIVKVRLGQKVIIEVDSYLSINRKFDGVVTEIANTANATATADAVTEFKVKIRILNESYQDLIDKKSKLSPFRPGMTAAVEVITDKRVGVLSVPIAAVTTRNDEEENKDAKPGQTEEKKKSDKVKQIVFVYDAKEGKVVQREVKTGISDIENIEIVSGLKEGDEVVVGPFNLVSKTLKNDQKVQKVDKNELNKAKK
ncbi:MAG: efflux RND transporter periplasmic adaptor subunit [Microscillaceae bacterium]|jgi:HlyD family secretion protein|nr:efflux RND transporter periplasmic adaptor subunit [Microscillaceae bacterium]